jgi:dienelactone hydrolase
MSEQLTFDNCRLGDSMAKAGYFVVMPDLFDGDPIPLDAIEKGFEFPPWLSKHPPERVDSIVEATIKEMRERYGVKKIGAVGYCFGGRYVVRFLAKDKGLDAGFAAHPSLVESSEFEAVTGPLSLALAGSSHVPSARR